MQTNIIESQDVRSINIKPNNLYLFGVFTFYVAFAFNFNMLSVLNNAEIIRALISVISTLGFIVAYQARGPAVVNLAEFRFTTFMLNIWIFYALYLFTVTLFRSGEVVNTIYYCSPFYLMAMSMILTTRHIEAGFSALSFWTIFVIMAIVSTLITFYFARYSSDLAFDDPLAFIEDVRYKVISSVSSVLLTVGMVNIARGKRLAISTLFTATVIFIYAISKTRNLLVGLSALTIYSILIADRRFAAALRIGLLISLALFIAYLIPFYTRNFDLLGAWIDRFIDSDRSFSEETYLTRLAEYQGQLKMLLSNPFAAIFGFGVLEKSMWDASIWDILNPGNDPTYYYDTFTTGLHSTWINSLFQAGFVIGLVPSFSITFGVVIALSYVFLSSEQRANLDIYSVYACAMLVLVWGPASFGSIFGDRLGPMSVGVCLIYAVFGWELFRKSLKFDNLHNRSLDQSSFVLKPHVLSSAPNIVIKPN